MGANLSGVEAALTAGLFLWWWGGERLLALLVCSLGPAAPAVASLPPPP